MGNTQMVPNIFTYATMEQSQDALICWLVAFAKDETDERLRECGRKFVQALMRSGDGAVIDGSNDSPTRIRNIDSYEIGEIPDGPKPQSRNIDVYFQAEVDGKASRIARAAGTHIHRSVGASCSTIIWKQSEYFVSDTVHSR